MGIGDFLLQLHTLFKGITLKVLLIRAEGEALMFQNLELFKIAGHMLDHASQRNALAALNVAHADTAGYKAQDLSPFSLAKRSATLELARVHSKHIAAASARQELAPPEMDYLEPNGNSVSLEREMMRASDIRRQHDHAIAIYRSTMRILRSSLGR